MLEKNLKTNINTVFVKQNIYVAGFNPGAPFMISNLGCKKVSHGFGHHLEQRLNLLLS